MQVLYSSQLGVDVRVVKSYTDLQPVATTEIGALCQKSFRIGNVYTRVLCPFPHESNPGKSIQGTTQSNCLCTQSRPNHPRSFSRTPCYRHTTLVSLFKSALPVEKITHPCRDVTSSLVAKDASEKAQNVVSLCFTQRNRLDVETDGVGLCLMEYPICNHQILYASPGHLRLNLTDFCCHIRTGIDCSVLEGSHQSS